MTLWKLARTTWAKAPGPHWLRSRRIVSGSTSTTSSSGPGPPTFRMLVSRAAPPIPRPLAWRFTTPAPTSSPGFPFTAATNYHRSPLFGAGNAGVIARDGRLFRRDDESRSESYADVLRRAGLAAIEGQGTAAADPAAQATYAVTAHGAVFAEVKVDPDLGQIRVTRFVGAFAAGRIINPRMVRSQLCGGMIWGVSFALHERAVMDPRSG